MADRRPSIAEANRQVREAEERRASLEEERSTLLAERETQRESRQTAIALLGVYGDHLPDCAIAIDLRLGPEECSCGWHDVASQFHFNTPPHPGRNPNE